MTDYSWARPVAPDAPEWRHDAPPITTGEHGGLSVAVAATSAIGAIPDEFSVLHTGWWRTPDVNPRTGPVPPEGWQRMQRMQWTEARIWTDTVAALAIPAPTLTYHDGFPTDFTHRATADGVPYACYGVYESEPSAGGTLLLSVPVADVPTWCNVTRVLHEDVLGDWADPVSHTGLPLPYQNALVTDPGYHWDIRQVVAVPYVIQVRTAWPYGDGQTRFEPHERVYTTREWRAYYEAYQVPGTPEPPDPTRPASRRWVQRDDRLRWGAGAGPTSVQAGRRWGGGASYL